MPHRSGPRPPDEPVDPAGGFDEADLVAPGPEAGPSAPEGEGGFPTEEEALLGAGWPDLPDLVAERDQYLDSLRRVKAEFDNYRKRTAREQAEAAQRAGGRLAADLLPVLDACDAALGHGAADVEPIRKSLLEVLGRAGLERMDPVGQPFDPNLHDAVMHEPGDEGEAVVAEDLRAGYLWSGQVIRPAMVKVRG